MSFFFFFILRTVDRLSIDGISQSRRSRMERTTYQFEIVFKSLSVAGFVLSYLPHQRNVTRKELFHWRSIKDHSKMYVLHSLTLIRVLRSPLFQLWTTFYTAAGGELAATHLLIWSWPLYRQSDETTAAPPPQPPLSPSRAAQSGNATGGGSGKKGKC